MLKYRLITGPILIAVLLGIVMLDDALDRVTLEGFWRNVFQGRASLPRGLALFGLALVVMPIAAHELSKIFEANLIETRKWLTALAAIFGLVLSYSIPMKTEAIHAIAIVSSGMIVVFVASLLTFSQSRNVEGVVAAAGAVMFAMVYLGLMMGFLLLLRREHSAWWVVGVVLITKSCDTGAYFTGRALGRNKMAPFLSPGKTWEGLIGGELTAMLAGTLLAWLSHRLPHEVDHVPLWMGPLAGALFAMFGQFGDLLKSMFKRSAGIKDSGRVLPGLGGVLDVVDSPLMVAPVAYWLLEG